MSDTFAVEAAAQLREAHQATPAAVLRQHIMDPNVPKNEAEWWAAGEIERLTASHATLTAENERLNAELGKTEYLLKAERSSHENAKDAAVSAGRAAKMRQDVIYSMKAEAEALRGKVGELERQFKAEYDIVDRIWTQFGRPNMAELDGRSIHDLISELKARANEAEAQLATARRENDALRGALKPFAAVADDYDDREDDHLDILVDFDFLADRLRLKVFRAARNALLAGKELGP